MLPPYIKPQEYELVDAGCGSGISTIYFAKNYPFIPSDLMDCAYKKEVGVVEEIKGKGTYVTYKGNIKCQLIDNNILTYIILTI